MYCASCGNELPDGSAFCPRCAMPVRGAAECVDFAYEAFISYRHVPEDRALAKRIQRSIEGYRIPAGLEDGAGRRRLGKCFRDEDELPTSDSLPNLIDDALRRSRFLIVICSPRMRESRWVAREVELFSAYHGRDHVLLALASGEPAGAFPPLLMSLAEKDGEVVVERETEPIAADMRSSSHKRFSDEVLRILAPIVGCGYDDLRQRARSRRMKNIAVAACATAALGVAFGGFALFQQAQIRTNYESALRNQSEYLAEESTTLLEQGERMQAVQVALHALGEDGGDERPYVPSARLALEQACQVYPERYWRPCYSNIEDAGTSIYGNKISINAEGSLYATLDDQGFARVYDLVSGAEVAKIPAPSVSDPGLTRSSISLAGKRLVCVEQSSDQLGDRIVVYDATTGDELRSVPPDQLGSLLLSTSSIGVSDDGRLACIAPDPLSGGGGLALIVDLDQAMVLSSLEIPEAPEGSSSARFFLPSCDPSFSPDGTYAVCPGYDCLYLYDIAAGTWETIPNDLGAITSLLVTDSTVFTGSFVEDETSSFCVVAAHDPFGHTTLWTHREPAIAHSPTLISTPKMFEVTDTGLGRILIASIGRNILTFDPETGAIISTLATEAPVDTAHFFGDTQSGELAYVCQGTLHSTPNLSNPVMAETAGVLMSVASPPSATFLPGDNDPSPDATGIRIFTNVAGGKVCLLASSEGTVVYQYSRLCIAPEKSSVPDETSAALGASSISVSCNGEYLAGYSPDEGRLYLLDGATFAPEGSFDVQALLGLEEAPSYQLDYSFGTEREVLYLHAEDRLFALDCATGEICGSLPSVITSLGPWFETRDGLVRVLEKDDDWNLSLVTADARTLEVVSKGPLPESISALNFQELATVGPNLLVGLSDGTIHMFDLDSLEETSSDLSNTSARPMFTAGPMFAVDSTHDHIALWSDDAMCVFDGEGRKLWSYPAPNGTNNGVICFLSNGNVFLQADSTQCLLLDGSTGAELAASQSTGLGAFTAVWTSQDDSRLYAHSDGVYNLVAINLSPESFGEESAIREGLVNSSDGRIVLVDDGRETYTLPLYTTDELVAYARDLIKGHELTDAERRIYHLE